MAITINGSGTISGATTLTDEATIDGLTVGQGAGNVASNTAVGKDALDANTTGAYNTAIGQDALGANTSGNYNQAFGNSALLVNTTGSSNSAMGQGALGANTTGSSNSAFGYYALVNNTTSSESTAVGYQSMYSNTTGIENVALGFQSLRQNSTGQSNTAIGHQTAYNTTGSYNSAFGRAALYANTSGANNTALGYYALVNNTTASNNTAVGYQAGYNITTGYDSVFLGRNAGQSATTGYRNTYIGSAAGYWCTTGSNNTILGAFNGYENGLDIRTSSNNIVLSDGDGNPRLHYNHSVTAWRSLEIYNNTSGSAANMVILSSGTIARSTSSRKYKRDIKDATHGLAEVMQLRSVTYKGKNQEDGERIFGGLIAEEVHDAGLTEFVQYDDEDKPDALAYGSMVSLCIKAIQELSTKLDEANVRIAALESN